MSKIENVSIVSNCVADKKAIVAVSEAFKVHSEALRVLAEALNFKGNSIGIQINEDRDYSTSSG